MKFFYCLLFFFHWQELLAQDSRPASDDRVGIYRSAGDLSLEFHVSRDGDQLRLQIMDQGRLLLTPLSPTRFLLKGVKPKATLEFLKDSSGHIGLCRVYQD